MKEASKASLGSIVVLVLLMFLIPGTPTVLDADVQTVTMQDITKLPDAVAGKEYRVVFRHSSFKNLEWAITSGEIPKALALASNGQLVGTIDEKVEIKMYKFEVRASGLVKEGTEVCLSYMASLKVVPDPAKKKVDFDATESLRMVGGYQFSQSSSAEGKSNGFFDLYLSTPMPGWTGLNRKSVKLEMSPWRVWVNLRLTTVPQQNEKNIGALGPEYFSDLSKLKFNEIANAAEFMLGLDITLWRTDKILSNGHVTLGLLLAAGAITNITPTSDSVKTFKISDEFKERYPDENYDKDPQYVGFVPQERDRFYRQYYAGFRLKAYAHENGNQAGNTTFPAMLDATWGLNDAVSGGQGHFFKKSVFRFDLFFPFKILDFPMYFFGTLIVNTDKESVGMPLFLDPTTDADKVTPTSPNLLKIAVPENDRDYYRIGLGIDLSALLKKKNGKDKK